MAPPASAPAFQPRGILTLTTDLGTRGPYVGVLHGVMLAQHPDARLVDLTHEVEVHWPAEAGFWIERSYRAFPAGTVHVAVVESLAGSDRDGLVVLLDGHAFVGPDNGLLAPLAEREGARVHEIGAAGLRTIGIDRVSPTFRGRDAQGPVGGALASGRLRPEEVGPRLTDWAPSLLETPTVQDGRIHGLVVTVDGFGNVITNVDATELKEAGKLEVLIAGRRVPVRRSYGDGRPGELVALVNAFGVLEIARAQGSAADALGVGRGAPIIVERSGDG